MEMVERTLFLNGTIAEDSWFDDDVTPQMFKEELMDGSGDITVWINSPGGDCVAAAQIYNMLREYDGNVTVKIDGIAASAASVIAMAGDKVLMSPVSMMMIHNPMTIAFGDSGEMQKAIDMLAGVKDSIINAYELKTGLSRTRLSHLMDAETWMDANKAIELGFADEIIKRNSAVDLEVPQISMLYSKTAVVNSLMDKIAEKCRIQQKNETENDNKVKADSLMSRLNLMKNWRQSTMTILELREKRNKAWEAAKAFVETKRDKDGLLSAEDTVTYAEMEQKVQNYSAEIARMEEMEAMEAELNKPVNTPITGKPMNGGKAPEKKTGRASDEYKDAMLHAIRNNFRNIRNVLSEGIDTDGGYLVPEEYDSRLIEGLEEENIFRRLGTTITTSGERKINIAGSKPAAAWIDEGEALTFGDAKFDQINLDAHKLHVAVKVTEELLYDNAFGLENYLIRAFSRALANAEEDAFLNGDGTGKPLGIFSEQGGGEIGVTAASATEITADEIINLVYALKRPYRKKAKFIMNDATIAALRKLKDENGQYLWQPSLQAGEPDRLFGYEVMTSAYVPTIAAGKPVIAFGDFSYYNIGDRGVRSFAELKELFAGNGMVGFVAKERVDGKLVLAEAVQILKMGA